MTSFVDLMLLARASCLVFTESGFSMAALWWGNHSCAVYGGEAVWRLKEQLRAAVAAEKLEGEGAEGGGRQQHRHARRELSEGRDAAGHGHATASRQPVGKRAPHLWGGRNMHQHGGAAA
jgi:hypothetical protein